MLYRILDNQAITSRLDNEWIWHMWWKWRKFVVTYLSVHSPLRYLSFSYFSSLPFNEYIIVDNQIYRKRLHPH